MLQLSFKLLTLPVVFLGVSLCTFLGFVVLPGDAAEQLLGGEALPEQVARLRADLNLQGTPWERYRAWLGGVASGDLGTSVASGLPVTNLIAERLPVTLQLMVYALAVALAFAVTAALFAARRPRGWVDRTITAISVTSLSVPNYTWAIVLVYAFAATLPLFPSIGFTPLGEGLGPNVRSLTLPALALALPLFGLYAQFLRSDLLEQMEGESYVATAAAKGLGPIQILVRHALRNSLFGLLTVVALHVGTLISGAVVIEQMFALPGVGQLLLQALSLRDVAVVQGVALVLVCMTVLGSMTVDVLYAVVDPRVRTRVR